MGLCKQCSPIETHVLSAFLIQDHRVVVHIDSWESTSLYPNGHSVRVLGQAGELETEVQTILVENCIHVPPFSEAQVCVKAPRILIQKDNWIIQEGFTAAVSTNVSVLSSERCQSTLLRGRGRSTPPRQRCDATSGRVTWCSALTQRAARTWTTRCPCAPSPAEVCWS